MFRFKTEIEELANVIYNYIEAIQVNKNNVQHIKQIKRGINIEVDFIFYTMEVDYSFSDCPNNEFKMVENFDLKTATSLLTIYSWY